MSKAQPTVINNIISNRIAVTRTQPWVITHGKCSDMTTAETPEPFTSFVIKVLFHHEIPRNVVGSAARHFSVIRVFCGFYIFVCFVSFMVSEIVFCICFKLLAFSF